MITIKRGLCSAEPPLFTFDELHPGDAVIIQEPLARKEDPYLVAYEHSYREGKYGKCLVRLVYNPEDSVPCHVAFSPRTDRVFRKVNLLMEIVPNG